MEREYQTKAQAEIWQAWESHRAVMFQLATGGGKTVCVTHIIRDILKEGKRVIFIAHRKELIKQAWNTFYKNNILSGIIKAGVDPNYKLPCQVGSIQTMVRRELPDADYIIVDEGHHCLEDNSYGKLINERYPDAKVLAVTATPYRLGGKGFTKMFQTLIQSVNVSDLIDMGFLVPMRYYACSIPDMSGVKLTAGDYAEEQSVKAMELAPVVESYLEHCQGKSGLVFAVNIEHSKKIVAKYLEAGIPAEHVDANTDQGLRDAIFKRLRDKITLVVSNVGIATEGTDIPNLDFVQLCRPTKALNLWLQMVGRGLRADNDTIKHADTDDHRKLLISCSEKPFCTILDNAGLATEHQLLPDHPIDWQRYFEGHRKKKKTEETIDIIEFVVEDEDGEIKRTKIPKETEGLKLIEVTRREREKIINLTSLKEFDRLLGLYGNLPKIKKPGFKAYYDYKDYCRKQSILMTDDVWQYMELRLSTKDREQPLIDDAEVKINYINGKYQDDPHREFLLNKLDERLSKDLAQITRFGCPKGFMTKEKNAYFREINDSKIPHAEKEKV